ncbi:MAG: hypothetical protein RQ748_00715 [Elusimicrobiales bacterium]|nr:hypothetical protein [Elusimicrobiales bacterium]
MKNTGKKSAGAELRTLDPHISDLMGVLAGVKPVLYTDISASDEEYIKRLCSRFGLLYLKPESGGSRHFHFRPEKFMVLIGRRRRDLEAAARSWRSMDSDGAFIDWGCLLGYPECCVRRYLPWSDPGRLARIRTGFLDSILSGTRDLRGGISFLLNNVFNFFSTPYRDGPEKDREMYGSIMRINSRDLPLPNLNVVCWHPCSYDCAGSLRRAALTFAELGRHMPDFAAMLRDRLSRPVLSMGKYRFLVFSRAKASRVPRGALRIEHGGLTGPLSLMPASELRALNSERVLTVRSGRILSAADRLLSDAGRGCRPVFLDFRSEVEGAPGQGKGE